MLIDKKRESTGIAIIQDISSGSDIRSLLNGRSWIVLSFLSNHEERMFLNHCITHDISIYKVIRVRDVLEHYSSKTRERYKDFMSDWPIDTLIRGISFKNTFTYRNEVSYWWLTDASMKQNEYSPTFDYLCYLELIDSEINMSYSKCVYIGDDNLLSLLILRLCQKHDIHFTSTTIADAKIRLSFIYSILLRFWFAFKIFFIWMFFKLFNCRKPKVSSRVLGFYTIYPSTSSLETSTLDDRNYRQLPEMIDNHSGYKALFLVSFHPKKLRHWKTALKSIITKQNQNAPYHVFMESFLTFRDVIMVLTNLAFVAKYFILHKYNSEFRTSFKYLGIDIYELIGTEQAKSLLGNQLPYHLILARLTERAINKYPMTHLVCFLELYPSARAIYYGASKSKNSIKTVAYQHASINSMKLWYNYSSKEVLSSVDNDNQFISTMPIPDMYFFQGNLGRRIILESGYPKDRCLVTGSPRYDTLAQIRKEIDSQPKLVSQESTESLTPRTKQILVAPSLSIPDAVSLIEATLIAWQKSSSEFDNNITIQITVKPHPATILSHELKLLSEKYGYTSLLESSEDLYELILKSDVVITSYSTAGDEAIALKTPVICYSETRMTMSSFVDIPAAPIVHDPEELNIALNKIISPKDHPLYDPDFITPYRDHWQSLIDESFYKLDTHASDRIISELRRSQ